MRIGELARLAEVSPKAIRRYESLGLVAPTRHANGYREYDDDTIRLVREIRSLNRLGIPVEETRPFLDCLVAGSEHGDDCPESLAEYHRAITDLTTQIDILTARRDGLVQRLHEAARRTAGPLPEAPTHEGPQMTEIASITDDTFQQKVLDQQGTVLVDFWAEWCPPCHMIKPVLAEVASERADALTIYKLNTDENPLAVREYAIMSQPTLLLFRDGELVRTLVGARSKKKLLSELDAALQPHDRA
ncbi:thioredoxin [Nocardia sp. NPDC059764]|uniref:thioredoxin n=1 Tax=Nocardia sp. NPDC059764 TaxID=3346939 RepID=UPI0036472352